MATGDTDHVAAAPRPVSHPTATPARRISQKKSQKEQGAGAAASRHGARNQHRHRTFLRWVLADGRFPSVVSSHGRNASSVAGGDGGGPRPISVVVDVAGGRGENTLRLGVCHGVGCLLVDPRTADASDGLVKCLFVHVVPRLPKRWADRVRKRFGHLYDTTQEAPSAAEAAEEAGGAAAAAVAPGDGGRADDVVPHVRLPLGRDFPAVAALPARFSYEDITGRHNRTAAAAAAPDRTAATTTTTPEDVLAAILGGTSRYRPTLLLGLHADQPTEDIVSLGLLYDIPFAVVPCCVFPNLFTQRYVIAADGTRRQVRSYDQFVDYLQQKDPDRIRRDVVGFGGRDICLWYNGTTISGQEGRKAGLADK